MLFQDKNGRIMTGDEVDELFAYEVEDLGIHVVDEA